jgi:phage FluMu protein gp41
MITEKGTLPIGIEKDGKWHRDFEIRPALVKDTVEVADEQEPKKLDNPSYYGICLTAKQIVRIGDISPVPVEVVMEMYDDDIGEISAAKARLAIRLRSFRAESEGGQSETGEAAPADKEHADAGAGAAQDQAAAGSDS